MMSERRIVINPRCKTTINHLKNATWDKSRKEFKRSAENGHYDAVDALAYWVRNLVEGHNPYPSGYSFNKLGRRGEYFINPSYNPNTTTSSAFNKLNDIFKSKSSFRKKKAYSPIEE